jgi:hypothetical protein
MVMNKLMAALNGINYWKIKKKWMAWISKKIRLLFKIIKILNIFTIFKTVSKVYLIDKIFKTNWLI